jgi:prevent-host-death family protein
MPQFNIHEAKSNLSHLLELVAHGESVIIARNGTPVAEIVPFQRKSLKLGAGAGDPLVNPAVLEKDEWWKPMTDQEADDFLEGR